MRFWLRLKWISEFLSGFARRKRAGSSMIEELDRVHRLVQARFPGTPWVYGGVWSWYASDLGSAEQQPRVLIMYQYLPLAVVDRVSQQMMDSAKMYGIVVFALGGPDSELEGLLDSLEERAILAPARRK